RGAPARVPGPRDPGARAEAHAVDGGRRRDTLGRADPEPGVTRVYLALGSNAGDRLATLKSAIRRLHGIETVRFLDASPLYDPEPDLEHPVLYRSVRELLAELVDEHDVRQGDYPARWFAD